MSQFIAEKYYTYELAYPQEYPDKEKAGTVFYVGKGKQYRINFHEYEARKGVDSYKCDIIRTIWSHGLHVVKRKVFETNIEQDTCVYEWILIHLVYGKETLANINDSAGVPSYSKLTTALTFCVPQGIVDMIYENTIDSYTGYIQRLIENNIDIIENMRRGKLLPKVFHPQYMKSCCPKLTALLPFDLIDLLDEVQSWRRTDIIEYLLWREREQLNWPVQLSSHEQKRR